MGLGLSGSRSSAPTSAASRATRTPSCSCAGCSTATLTPFCRNHSEIGNVDQYAWSWGEPIAGPGRRRDRAALPAAALPLRRVPARAPRPARRCSGRSSSTTSTTRPSATSTTSTCSARTCSSRRSSRPGITARHVYLPAGDWYDWHTGRALPEHGFVRRRDADGPHPDLRARRRRHPDVARRARRRPTATTRDVVELHLFVPARRRHAPLVPAGGRRAHLRRRAREPATATTFERHPDRRPVTLRADVEGDGYPEFAREAFHLVRHGAAPGGRRRRRAGRRRATVAS